MKNIDKPGLVKMKKGISPLIATVLLIAFTVAVAGIVSMWLTSFSTTSVEDVGKRADAELYCTYGALSVSDLQFCNSYLSGIIRNSGTVAIGNITIQITFQNATPVQKVYLTQDGTTGTNNSNMTLKPVEIASFNVTVGGSNYNKIHVYSNCSNVYDDVVSSDVTATC